jgi:hypothetical protein
MSRSWSRVRTRFGCAEENNEETEFAVAEPYGLAIAVLQAPRIEVQLPTVETVGANSLRPALLYFGPAAQHGAYPCEQLAWAERFGYVIVVTGDLR